MSFGTLNGIGVSKPSGKCAATGRAIEAGEAFVATLVERAGQAGLERQDFCAQAWSQGARPNAPARLFGNWRSVMPASTEQRKQLLSDEELLDLFEELGAATEPSRLAFRYVLGLMLVRRRVLRMVGERRSDGARAMLVRPRGASPDSTPIEVADPGMDEATINDVIEQVGSVVGGEAAA